MNVANRDLLRRILNDARDSAATLAEEDEIRVLMLTLHVLPTERALVDRDSEGRPR